MFMPPRALGSHVRRKVNQMVFKGAQTKAKTFFKKNACFKKKVVKRKEKKIQGDGMGGFWGVFLVSEVLARIILGGNYYDFWCIFGMKIETSLSNHTKK